jgi:hypothetical protein
MITAQAKMNIPTGQDGGKIDVHQQSMQGNIMN